MWCIGQIRPTPPAPASEKPFGPGEFGPNPSGFGLGRATSTTAPKPSTLAQIPAGSAPLRVDKDQAAVLTSLPDVLILELLRAQIAER